MRHVRREVARQDAREDESPDPRRLRRIDEIAVPDVVHGLERVPLPPPGVPRRCGDESFHSLHRTMERWGVEHVPTDDLDALRRKVARVRPVAHEGPHVLPTGEEGVHRATPKVPRATHDEHAP